MINIKKLLPILTLCLFTLQCEQGWLENIIDPTLEGCNISTACNYNPDVNKFDDSCEYISCIDCLGYPNGAAVVDNCGTCDASPLNDCIQDCSGVWGGTATTDNCGNCSTSSIACEVDCMGVWGGTTVIDACGVCGGNLSCIDCNGVLNGSAYIDACQVCVSGNTGQTACTTTVDCAGVVGGTSYADNCGTCDSDFSNDCSQDCAGVWGGSSVMDACNICGGNDTICQDCAGTINGPATVDNCGTCDADATNDCSQDCNGTWGGNTVLDNCGICGGDNSDCTDCSGVVGGSATTDNCSVCDSDSSNDCTQDCAGTWGGTVTNCESDCSDPNTCSNCTDCEGSCCPSYCSGNYYYYNRSCSNGFCVGATSDFCSNGCTEDGCVGALDCEGVVGGSATVDNCGVCGGSDGCLDCAGTVNGSATEDNCGVCGGDNSSCGTITDIDGNTYETIKIGDQNWMAENLKVTKYKDGTAIPTGHGFSEWLNLTSGAYAVYDDNSSNADIYGNLYNWYAVENQQVCMDGWHVPTDDEIKQLEMYLGMSQEEADESAGYRGTNEGSKLAGMADLWINGNLENNPEFGTSGFTGFPSGYRGGNYMNSELDYRGYFWSSTENVPYIGDACFRHLDYDGSGIYRDGHSKTYGLSIRCIEGAVDCAGVLGGSATVDNCGDCVGGNTGNTACVQDCAGTWGGTNFDANNDGICDDYQGTVSDIDGNTYETIKIGDQNWMAENLKVTKYKDDSEIPNITNNSDWGSLTTGAYGDYDNNPTHSETYGRLYNWYAVDNDRGICPEGWHVPLVEEWTVLTGYLGGDSVAGGKMKETGTEHWDSPNTGATNESGFTGLPAGWRNCFSGDYYQVGEYVHFWSSDRGEYPRPLELSYDNSNFTTGSADQKCGYSIRCLKD